MSGLVAHVRHLPGPGRPRPSRVLRAGLVLALLQLGGCASLLPSGESATASPWERFDQAKQAFDQIEPFETGTERLTELGFDPEGNPNVNRLSYSDILTRFAGSPVIRPSQLDPGIRRCIAGYDACEAFELQHESIDRERYGNFWADFFNFRRKTRITGWRFNAVIMTHDGTVVFKQWSGEPQIKEYDDQTYPLGPLQGIGPAVAREAR